MALFPFWRLSPCVLWTSCAVLGLIQQLPNHFSSSEIFFKEQFQSWGCQLLSLSVEPHTRDVSISLPRCLSLNTETTEELFYQLSLDKRSIWHGVCVCTRWITILCHLDCIALPPAVLLVIIKVGWQIQLSLLCCISVCCNQTDCVCNRGPGLDEGVIKSLSLWWRKPWTQSSPERGFIACRLRSKDICRTFCQGACRKMENSCEEPLEQQCREKHNVL